MSKNRFAKKKRISSETAHPIHTCHTQQNLNPKKLTGEILKCTLFQERAVFGKMKMDPAKRAQTQNAVEVPSHQWFFFQSIEMMTDKVWLHCIRLMLLK